MCNADVRLVFTETTRLISQPVIFLVVIKNLRRSVVQLIILTKISFDFFSILKGVLRKFT